VEIFDENASKGIAISKLAEHLGISKNEIACIGDGENDLTMFAQSGIKFAMGNAVEALKENADYILPDNNSDGVAFAIENYIL
jgi:hydroxymethylpyrimidine pyrophosphatase-like HAD family hydrolase